MKTDTYADGSPRHHDPVKLREPSNWQSIESAPKDGTRIMVIIPLRKVGGYDSILPHSGGDPL